MLKLLIVDDSNVVRKRVDRFLDNNKIEVVGTARNGIEALEIFDKTNPDLVTMDITMPEMDGITCVDEMLKINDTVRILVISALADESSALKALKIGARGYLCKPFSQEELNEAFDDLLEG